MSTIVYGPQGCGKNQEAGEKIAQHLGLSHVVRDWFPGMDVPEDSMIFSEFPTEGALDFFEVMALRSFNWAL
jgi:hypothetical protein